MKRKWTYWGTGLSLAILALVLGVTDQERTTGNTEVLSARPCPYDMPSGPQCRIEIVRMSFTRRIESLLYLHQIPQAATEQYRFAVVTLKITKPAGASLSLAAADLTLHYYHGDEPEVAPCEGISGFKRNPDADVPILMSPLPGPGFVKQTTDQAGTHGTVVYIDAVFGFMEPDTRECWICLARPTTAEPFVCPAPAWNSERPVRETVPEPVIPAAQC